MGTVLNATQCCGLQDVFGKITCKDFEITWFGTQLSDEGVPAWFLKNCEQKNFFCCLCVQQHQYKMLVFLSLVDWHQCDGTEQNRRKWDRFQEVADPEFRVGERGL